jgi:hypothetical protein
MPPSDQHDGWRRANRPVPLGELEILFEQMRREGDGCRRLVVLNISDLAMWIGDALGGDPVAAATVNAVLGALDNVTRAAEPPLCLLCDFAFASRAAVAAIVVLAAAVDRPRASFASGLCARCAARPDVFQAAIGYLKQNAIADLRVLPPLAASGRA